ncbi:MAG: hypothetical protein K0Q54_4121 [Methylobacterium brachiatum]|nr:hypothetical protein [Methylobacterium brachiatum]
MFTRRAPSDATRPLSRTGEGGASRLAERAA